MAINLQLSSPLNLHLKSRNSSWMNSWLDLILYL
ncbi:hypothetical protein BVRB_9g225790 [Beta vulgaris subsp. vulgaris]|uniref:Uncharacterized protein n=1 Tax=Beta vulgaris subsp. vulgaris TaxID=3555 RepID=A0A0J8B561_BETVV|nr:hypothetical protein BVRB_9g225790 [Beta vulgaris subsp. vulgaris]